MELRGADANAAISGDMHGRQLQGAEYIKADLTKVDLSASDLTGAVFNDADLRNAVLENGLLFMQSSFTDARISGAGFTDAVVDRSQLPQLCHQADGHNSITDRDTRAGLALTAPSPKADPVSPGCHSVVFCPLEVLNDVSFVPRCAPGPAGVP